MPLAFPLRDSRGTKSIEDSSLFSRSGYTSQIEAERQQKNILNNSEDVTEKQATITKCSRSWNLVWVLLFALSIGDLYFCGNRRGRPTASGSADFEGRDGACCRTADGER